MLVGENGYGKSSVVDAIRALLGENEFSRRGIIEEDFYSVFCESQKKSSESLFISGVFSNLTEAQKVEYLSWLDEDFNASIMSAVGNIYGQKTQIRFNILLYERIIESLQLLFSDDLSSNLNIFRSLSENSLGYNNLIYIATILAEFEGLKDRYTTPRILLIEELEAHLHPQLQIKLLQYLQKQATEFDIQVIITTHSSLLAASVPFESIIALYKTEEGISITPLIECGVDKSASGFLNRWLDATKTALFFSKGNIFVEGIAEAILIPELAKVYLRNQNEDRLTKVTSLEEAGISVINMNGIYFQYFMQLYNGYSVIIPNQKDRETEKDYKERVHTLIHKDVLSSGEFVATKKIEARCVAITDNDPETDVYPSKDDYTEGNNPQLYYAKQIENMTENCRVFINRKTFEYDLALESHHNAKMMLEILIEEIPTDGSIKRDMEDYIAKIDAGETIDDTRMAGFILKQVDSNQVQKLINCYSNILNEEGLLMNESRIIVRNNSVKNKILGKKVTTGTINTIEDFAHFVYFRKYNSLECFRGSTRVLARAIQRAFFANEVHGNSNNLYKPERLESAEWNAIIVSVQKKLIADSAVTDLNKTWSAWKKTLASCLGNIDIIPSHTIELKSIRRGMKDEKVIDTFSNSIGHDISITIETIHGCKGMRLDSVLFVSSYTKSASSSGAHWHDWFQHNETGISEAHRLAYVAFSRAKHLLALGIPNPHSAPLSEADKQMLTDCGFEIVEIAED